MVFSWLDELSDESEVVFNHYVSSPPSSLEPAHNSRCLPDDFKQHAALDNSASAPQLAPWKPLTIVKTQRERPVDVNRRNRSFLPYTTELAALAHWRPDTRPRAFYWERPSSYVPPPPRQTRVSAETTRRILEWRTGIEDYTLNDPFGSKGEWISFLPSCLSSNRGSSVSSSSSLDERPTSAVREEPVTQQGNAVLDVVPEESCAYELPRVPGLECTHGEVKSQVSASGCSEDDADSWPYNGRGLDEHHEKYYCGLGCYVACRWRRRLRPVKVFSLTRLLTKVGKQPVERTKNSEVPHPPWWLPYRSNDDTLGEDEDDGDLELWLEDAAQPQDVIHRMSLKLFLSETPDSRIFGS